MDELFRNLSIVTFAGSALAAGDTPELAAAKARKLAGLLEPEIGDLAASVDAMRGGEWPEIDADRVEVPPENPEAPPVG